MVYKGNPVSCDFQAQQSNLVQVARSLGRAVPLSPQLIFTPTATVAAVQPEGATPTTQPSTTTAQVRAGRQSAPRQGREGGDFSPADLQEAGLLNLAAAFRDVFALAVPPGQGPLNTI